MCHAKGGTWGCALERRDSSATKQVSTRAKLENTAETSHGYENPHEKRTKRLSPDHPPKKKQHHLHFPTCVTLGRPTLKHVLFSLVI